jgi:putative MFS transporter
VKDVLLVIIGALAVMVAVLLFFGIETNQRSLEEIAPDAPEAEAEAEAETEAGAALAGSDIASRQHH